MVFSSIFFLCIFFPIFFALYFLCPVRWRNFLLLVFSLAFYAWGEPWYILIMLFSTVFDYINGRLLEKFEGRERVRKGILILSVAGNLAILVFFKYTDFLIESLDRLAGTAIAPPGLALPVGISFYTFQTMSYTIDVYRGRVRAQRNLIDFAMYVSMFPQLIAGPVVRYESIGGEIRNRRTSPEQVLSGLERFCLGLGKKVLLANQAGTFWQELDSMESLPAALAWLKILLYTFQIYFDFSGYSDMAIGMGKMMGFHFPENFDYPYLSKSVTEFWRRWHMTLGTWFREYVYIPLGGNRRGIRRQIVNILIVWTLTGIWHGAGINFLLWGLYYGLLLLGEKLVWGRLMQRLPGFFSHVCCMFAVVLGWILFSEESFVKIGSLFRSLSGLCGLGGDNSLFYWKECLLLLVLLGLGSGSLPDKVLGWIRGKSELLYGGFCLCVLLLSLCFLTGDSYNPFLYFRF